MKNRVSYIILTLLLDIVTQFLYSFLLCELSVDEHG